MTNPVPFARSRASRRSPARAFIEAKTSLNIRFVEVDALQIVWHGHYVNYFEEGRRALGRRLGIDYPALMEQRLAVPVIHMEVSYFAPARLSDTLEITARLLKSESARLDFEYEIHRASDNLLLATGTTSQVFTTPAGELILHWPEAIAERVRFLGITVDAALNIAIASCGAISAAGANASSLQAAVAANASALSNRECLVGKTMQPVVAGFVARTEETDSREFHWTSLALQEALDALPAALRAIPPQRRGFVFSTTKANIDALDGVVAKQIVSASARRHIHPARLAADLAQRFACAGPMQCVSAACISGLLALQQGAAFLRRGQADLVLIAGVDVISHFVLTGFQSLKSLDPDGCRPFDRARVGLSLGEGAGAIVLARHGPILLTGCGVSNDANHLTGPSRDGSGLAMAIQRALSAAKLPPEEIDYIHAHGTGTPYNDAMESLAFRAVFGERVPPFSGSKGIIGHTLGAAGILESIIAVKALQARLLPGTPRLQERDPVAPESLLADPQSCPALRRILKVNCGFGGTNAAVILERSES